MSLIRNVIFEDNVETGTTVSPSAFDFVKGVQFHDGGANGGCTNYLVQGNDFGPHPAYIDNNNPPWSGTFSSAWLTGGTLPIPAHALRDL